MRKPNESWARNPPNDRPTFTVQGKDAKAVVLDIATNNLAPYMHAYVTAEGHTSFGCCRAIQWGGETTAFGQNVSGIMVSGGSAANLAA